MNDINFWLQLFAMADAELGRPAQEDTCRECERYCGECLCDDCLDDDRQYAFSFLVGEAYS